MPRPRRIKPPEEQVEPPPVVPEDTQQAAHNDGEAYIQMRKSDIDSIFRALARLTATANRLEASIDTLLSRIGHQPIQQSGGAQKSLAGYLDATADFFVKSLDAAADFVFGKKKG